MARKKVEDTEVSLKKKKNKKEKTTENISKKTETVIIANSEEEAQELINRIANEEVAETKAEKKKNFWSEVKALFCILLIIGLVILIGFLIYKYVDPIQKDKEPKEETKIVETSDYKTVSYVAEDKRQLDVLDNKYVIETKDTVLYKVLDMDSNVLFEGNEEYSYLYLGSDGRLYLLFYANDETNNEELKIYVFDDKKLEEVKAFKEKGYNYIPLLHYANGEQTLLGIVGESYSYEESFFTQTKLYLLNGEEYEIDEVRLVGDTVRLGPDEPIVTYNEDYIVAIDTKSEYKYGVYDLNENEMIINTKYDGLYTTNNGNYIAIKDKKAGIINIKSKILVDFKYEFISDEKDFYVVSTNKKLGILDKDYKEVIESTFAFQEIDNIGFSYKPCCGAVNSFVAYKYNDKYVLTINNDELYYNLDYKLHETYVINESGEYMTIQASEFGVYEDFLYSYDKTNKKYIIYDQTFAEKYTIDLSDYDLDGNPSLSYVHGNTLIISMGSTLYFDALTGDELESVKDATLVDDKIELKYYSANNSVSLKVDGKVISTYKYDEKSNNNFYVKVKDGMYYYVANNTFVMVRKSE